MPVNPVSPNSGVNDPHAGNVEAVDGMDVTVRADASDSEEVMKGSEGDGAESQEVQDEVVEASHTGQEEEAETQAPRAARAPHTPSQREIDDHNLVHCPYRAWCEACVRGQAKDDCHMTIIGPDADSSVTGVCIDYCFLTEKVKARESEHVEEVQAGVSMIILVMLETMCRRIWS